MELSLEKKQVLVVDRDPEMGVYLSRLLKAGGYEPVVAVDSEAGFRLALDIHPFLIILDAMPHPEGATRLYLDLKLNASLKDVPVIVLSPIGRKTLFHYQRVHTPGILPALPGPDAILEKPPEADELLRLAGRLIGRIGDPGGTDAGGGLCDAG